MNLEVKKPVCYDGDFPVFRQPTQIGCFSLDGEREYVGNGHQMKYIALPRKMRGIHLDLEVGYAEAIRKEFGKKERLDTLLKWILNNQDRVKESFYDPSSKKPKIDFVCFRGLITAISNTVYENKEDWMICATKFNSVIYLCAYDTEQAIRRRETATERDKRMCAWGYKFEQYLTSDSPYGKPDLSTPVNEKEEYCITLKSRLSNHTLLFSAEVDGQDPVFTQVPNPTIDKTQTYVELKTSRIITTERQDINFCRFKLLKWWLQSYLVGTPKIICGFRDDHGVVQYLDVFRVNEIPTMANGLWSASAALNFCCEFFNHVKTCVKKDDPYVVYKFDWKPGHPVTCEELLSPGEFQILPDWYIQGVNVFDKV